MEKEKDKMESHQETRERLSRNRQIINFMGPEGCGKTSISKKIASELNKPYISTGDILRDMAANDQTEYGDECRAMFAEHRYLNPHMLLDILVKRFRQKDIAGGFVLDGGLRIVEEVDGFPSVLERADRVMPLTIIYLRISGWMSAQRLVEGEEARKRDDDTVDGVLNRLSNFYNKLGQKATLIQRQKEWKLLQVNAMVTKEEAFNNVWEALAKKS